jgi:hypothetical protein
VGTVGDISSVLSLENISGSGLVAYGDDNITDLFGDQEDAALRFTADRCDVVDLAYGPTFLTYADNGSTVINGSSGDGTVMVGSRFADPYSNNEAWIWDPVNGTRLISTVWVLLYQQAGS